MSFIVPCSKRLCTLPEGTHWTVDVNNNLTEQMNCVVSRKARLQVKLFQRNALLDAIHEGVA